MAWAAVKLTIYESLCARQFTQTLMKFVETGIDVVDALMFPLLLFITVELDISIECV